MVSSEQKKLLVIIDSNSIVHRAYHALPPLTTKEGELVNAVYGFFSIFLKMTRELRPDFLAAAFDLPVPTFRHQAFPDYKAKRVKAPEEFYRQIPLIQKILADFNVPIFTQEGLEADDVIASLVVSARRSAPDLDIIMLSSDNDLLQLITDGIRALIIKKGVNETVLYDRARVREKYEGLEPEQLVDFKALRGDPSDNIPGVRGIGEKTALKLLQQFHSLDNLYSVLGTKVSSIPALVRQKLENSRELAFTSQKLAQIRSDAVLEFSLADCRWGSYDRAKVVADFNQLQFNSLLARL